MKKHTLVVLVWSPKKTILDAKKAFLSENASHAVRFPSYLHRQLSFGGRWADWGEYYGCVSQPGDTSDGLEIAGPNALVLNGSTIRRVSTFPSQAANLTFYSGGGASTSISTDTGTGDNNDEGSDSGTGGLYGFSLRGITDNVGENSTSSFAAAADLPPVAVDCSDVPVVLNVTSTAFAGEYGAGQRIYFQVIGYSSCPVGSLKQCIRPSFWATWSC